MKSIQIALNASFLNSARQVRDTRTAGESVMITIEFLLIQFRGISSVRVCARVVSMCAFCVYSPNGLASFRGSAPSPLYPVVCETSCRIHVWVNEVTKKIDSGSGLTKLSHIWPTSGRSSIPRMCPRQFRRRPLVRNRTLIAGILGSSAIPLPVIFASFELFRLTECRFARRTNRRGRLRSSPSLAVS